MTLRLLAALALFLPFTLRADPTAQSVLAEINFARTRPQEYARIVESYASRYQDADGARALPEAVAFLRRTAPLAPLSWSRGISLAAVSHALEVGSKGGRGHASSSGATPWRRMARHGEWSGHVGENIDYGNADARSIVVSLIVDRGVPGRGHRANLFSRNFRVAGIALAPHATAGTICVMDFATSFREAGEPRVAKGGFRRLRTEYMGRSFY